MNDRNFIFGWTNPLSYVVWCNEIYKSRTQFEIKVKDIILQFCKIPPQDILTAT